MRPLFLLTKSSSKKKKQLGLKQFQKSAQQNSMETRLADQQKHILCSNFCKKNVLLSFAKYPQRGGQGIENTKHKS